MALKINFDGLLKSPVSWAKVNRKLLETLVERPGVDPAIQPRRGFRWDRSFPLSESLKASTGRHDQPDLTLTFSFPPRLKRDREAGTPLVVQSLYEATRLPESWIEPLQQHPDLILIPSEHVRKIYEAHGIDPGRLTVVPYGYDPDVFFPDTGKGIDPDGLHLISIATPHFRKGLDLLRSVADTVDRDDVTWRIHSPFSAGTDPDEFWVDPWLQEDLHRRGFEVTTGSLDEVELARALRNADLCVQPGRSEGFGLVHLEAMASGTPVLTSDWGGHLTFQGEGMVTVESSLKPAGRSQYHRREPGARVAEPDPVRFRSALRRLIDEPTKLGTLGRKAPRTVEDLTWDRTADNYLKAMEPLLE